MVNKEDVLEFYERNKDWLEAVVSNGAYPHILRATAAAVIEIGLEKGGEKHIDR